MKGRKDYTFFTYEMLRTLGLLFNEYEKLVAEQHLLLPNMLPSASQAFVIAIFASLCFVVIYLLEAHGRHNDSATKIVWHLVNVLSYKSLDREF